MHDHQSNLPLTKRISGIFSGGCMLYVIIACDPLLELRCTEDASDRQDEIQQNKPIDGFFKQTVYHWQSQIESCYPVVARTLGMFRDHKGYKTEDPSSNVSEL